MASRAGEALDAPTSWLKALEVAPALGTTITRTEARHGDLAGGPLIHDAFRLVETPHVHDADPWCVKKVVDVPVQCLGAGQVPCDASFEAADRAAGIDITANREHANPERSDRNRGGLRDFDHELVGNGHVGPFGCFSLHCTPGGRGMSHRQSGS